MPKFLVLITLMLCGIASAAESDALDKCKSNAGLDEYYQLIDHEAERRIGSHPDVSVSIIPAFGEESVVALADNKVHIVWMKDNVWHQGVSTGFSNVRPQSKHTVAAISPSTYQRLVSTFSHYISSSITRESGGYDGVSFNFRSSTGDCAATWMPNPESTAGQLVEIILLLSDMPAVRGRQARARNEAQLNALLDKVLK